VRDLYSLNLEEYHAGYCQGFEGRAPPHFHSVTRSFYTGWHEGSIDGQHMALDDDAFALQVDRALNYPYSHALH
jgi:hypothetical protein